MSSVPIIHQLKTTLRLAVALTFLGASIAMADSVGRKRFVVTSTLDALRLARAASRVGTIIDAVVVGSVEIVKPIKIGNFTRLTLKGRGAGAQLTVSLDKGSTSNAAPDLERLPCATDCRSGLFDVSSNASLVLDNLSILQPNTSCAGLAVLIKLHSHSLVDAKGCTFRSSSSILNTSSDSGDVIGSRSASVLAICARRGRIRRSPSGQREDEAFSVLASERASEALPSSSPLLVLKEGARVVPLEEEDEGNRPDHGTDDVSWLTLDSSRKPRVLRLTSDASYLWVYPSPDRVESSAPTWWRQAESWRTRSTKGEGKDDNAAANFLLTPSSRWKKRTLLVEPCRDHDGLQGEGGFSLCKTAVWDDSGDGDGGDVAEQGGWEDAREKVYKGNRWVGEKVRVGAKNDAEIEIARKRERMDGIFHRRLDGYSCPEGYHGASCTDCASGFTMGPGGVCERTEVQCTAWTKFGGGLLAALGLSIFLLTLDTVRNGKSPIDRLAQIWQKAVYCCRRSRRFCQDIGIPNLTSKQVVESRTAARGMDGQNANSLGRETLARFLYGCISFIVTAQIVTQSTKVLELELPSAMEEVVTSLDWANMDPLLVPVTCSSVRASFPSFPDRAVGTVGLLTVCLAVLAFSQTTIALCGGSPESNEQPAPTRRRKMSQFARRTGIDVTVGDGEIRTSCAPCTIKRANGEIFRHAGQMPSVGTRLEDSQGRGAWEQWESWDSSERHAFAAILVCLLMHPVVCTMLLGVFDCRSIEGDDALWLRTDLSVECLSQHQTYLIMAAVFLGLYGIGIPLTLLAIVFWATTPAYDEEQDDTSSAGNESKTVGTLGSMSTATRSFFPFASRGLADSSAENKTFAAASSSTTVSAREHMGMDRSTQNEGGGSKVECTIASREEMDVELGTKHHLTDTSLGGKGEGEASRQDGKYFLGNSSWQDARLIRSESDHARWRVTDGGNPMLATNNYKNSCVARAWNLSGQCVLSVERAISSTTGPSTSSVKEGVNQLGKRWRCTIPLWWPYRTNRRWFAAWDLLRRTLLTGLLTLVPADEDGADRVAVACAIAGLSLVVAEVARPHRDPWIGWINRMGGIMILLVDVLGVFQQVSPAGNPLPSVAAVAVSVFFLLFLLLVLLCICCGWRLSCAEQREEKVTTAAVIPWPESASIRRHPSVVDVGIGDNDNRADSDQVECSSNTPPDVHVSWDKEEPISGYEAGTRDLRSATSSENGSSEIRTQQHTPSGRHTLAGNVDHHSNSSRRSISQSSPESLPEPFTVSTSLHNPMHSNSAGASERLSETAPSDSSSRGSTHSCSIGLHMPSRYPAPMAGAGIKRARFGFNTACGEVSSGIRASTEAHRTASGLAFHSNCGNSATCAQIISLSDLDAYEIVNPPTLATRSRSRSNSSELDGFANGSNMARRLLAIGAKAAEGRITAPIIAPGAPSIEGHKSRFTGNARPTRSSSSFVSTSFESSSTGERSRKGSASRGSGAWRRSASSSGFLNGSRSQSGSHSGDTSRSPGVGRTSAGCASNSPDPSAETSIGVGFSRGTPGVMKTISTRSGSFMSSGSSSISVNGWTNPAVGPPVLRSLRTNSSQDFGIHGSPSSLDSGLGSERISEVVRASSQVTRGLSGSPVNLPVLPEVQTLSRWTNHEYGGDASFAEEGGLGSGAAPHIVAVTGERAVTSEQKAPVDRVEFVFGDDNHNTEHWSSIPEGDRNVVQFRTLFVQKGGSGESSYECRTPGESGSGGRIDAEDSENATPKACSSIALHSGGQRYWEGDKTKTPLSSFELKQYVKQHVDFDSEDDPIDFSRVADRANTIRANVVRANAKREG